MSGDEIWDEERWELFLREHDKRVDRYMGLLFTFMADNAPPDREDAAAWHAWENALRAFLLAHGFPHEDALFLFTGDGPEDGEEFFDPGPEGEGYEDDLEGFREMPLYRQAFGLAAEVLEWSNALPGDLKDSTLVQFCTYITQIPANIAKGHGIGFERDMIGGNIACVKRGLSAANAALDLLRETKPEAYMDVQTYRRFYEQTYEVRNALGLYVQQLRERFDLGID